MTELDALSLMILPELHTTAMKVPSFSPTSTRSKPRVSSKTLDVEPQGTEKNDTERGEWHDIWDGAPKIWRPNDLWVLHTNASSPKEFVQPIFNNLALFKETDYVV